MLRASAFLQLHGDAIVGRVEAAAGPEAIASRLSAGLELMRAEAYFEAHEELELAWRAAEPGERDFFQGLVHVTVAWYQAGRGNRPGCERQLEKATRRLDAFGPLHRGVDVAGMLEQVEGAREAVAGGSLALPRLVV